MVKAPSPQSSIAIPYPDSDGQPMADNTLQFRWIVTLKENLDLWFREDPTVFVAGDLLWYPMEGNNKLRQAPDVMVVFGRPKGDRGSYRQWEEDNIAPQVVFEILSPGNRAGEMLRKLRFYEDHGVEEYYLYDPHGLELTGLLRNETGLDMIPEMAGWVSPRLQIRFELGAGELEIWRPDGQRFLTFTQLDSLRQVEQERAAMALKRATAAEAALEAERARSQRLEAQLRALGIDPSNLDSDSG